MIRCWSLGAKYQRTSSEVLWISCLDKSELFWWHTMRGEHTIFGRWFQFSCKQYDCKLRHFKRPAYEFIWSSMMQELGLLKCCKGARQEGVVHALSSHGSSLVTQAWYDGLLCYSSCVRGHDDWRTRSVIIQNQPGPSSTLPAVWCRNHCNIALINIYKLAIMNQKGITKDWLNWSLQ